MLVSARERGKLGAERETVTEIEGPKGRLTEKKDEMRERNEKSELPAQESVGEAENKKDRILVEK